MLSAKEFLKLLRDHGWSGKKVSVKMGHGQSWLSKKLHGAREMKCEELVRIAELTGIPPHALLGWEDSEVDKAKPRMIPNGSDDAILRELANILDPTQRQRFIAILSAGQQQK